MSIVERPKSMTEQAVDALKSFEPMVAMVLQYGDLTVEADGIGKVEEAHKALKRLRIDVDDKRSELNAPALEYQRTVNATAKQLIAQITTAEEKLKAQRDAHEFKKNEEKRAKEAEKAAALNERVSRLSSAGIVVSDLAALASMAPDEFEFYFAREARIASEAKAEAERLEAAHQAELRRQAEELRVRAEEMAAERQRQDAERAAEVERLRIEREAMEADRAEMRRQQEEVARQQEELRAKAEAEAAEKRRVERDAEEARKATLAAPELEKLEAVRRATVDAAKQSLTAVGLPVWSESVMNEIQIAFDRARDEIRKAL